MLLHLHIIHVLLFMVVFYRVPI